MEKKFKILSIDGGGIRGIIPAKVLCDLEEYVQKTDGPQARLCDYFDLICGTSTGGIIAIGLAIGMSAKDILKLYEENASQIFPNCAIAKYCRLIFKARFFDRKVLEQKLKEAYEGTLGIENPRIEHCKTRLCIPIYDLGQGMYSVLKTNHSESYQRDLHIPLVDAALATAAAPIYFSPYTFEYTKLNNETNMVWQDIVDGGVVANNPTLIGLIESQTLGYDFENVAILSIGTGEYLLKSGDEESKNCIIPKLHLKRKGFLYWLSPMPMRLYQLMSSAQSLFMHNTIKFLAERCPKNSKHLTYVRIQQTLCNEIDLATSKKRDLNNLKIIGAKLYERNIGEIQSFVSDKIEYYKHYNNN